MILPLVVLEFGILRQKPFLVDWIIIGLGGPSVGSKVGYRLGATIGADVETDGADVNTIGAGDGSGA